jgi:uncharacterized membrane protein YbhN (UPF0104 family)
MDLKNLSTYVGNILVLISFSFLAFLIYGLDFSSTLDLFKPTWIPFVVILSALFSLLYFLIAYAYKILLEMISLKSIDNTPIKIYLKTVVMKYLPGNVFHFLGRHSLVKTTSLEHKDIVFSNGAEIILQLLGVSFILFFGVLVFGFSLDLGEYIKLSQTSLFLAFSLLLVLVIGIVFSKKYREIFFKKSALVGVLKVLTLQSLFIVGSSLTFVTVLYLFFGVEFSFESLIHTIFIAIIAWFFGFVVPGAPGGIGIRESVLVLLLPSVLLLSKEVVLSAALIYRLITILGEALTYFWAKLVK